MSPTSRLHAIADEMEVDPFEILLHFASKNEAALGWPQGTLTPGHQLAAAMEAQKYLYPTVKSVDHVDKTTDENEEKVHLIDKVMELMKTLIAQQTQDIQPNPINLDGVVQQASDAVHDPLTAAPEVEAEKNGTLPPIEITPPPPPPKPAPKIKMVPTLIDGQMRLVPKQVEDGEQ